MFIDLQTGCTTGIACIQLPGRSAIQVAAKILTQRQWLINEFQVQKAILPA